MGLLSIFKRDEHKIVKAKLDAFHSRIMEAFSAIRQDLREQNKWISYLHSHGMTLKESHSAQKQDLVTHQRKINRWVENLHDNSVKQQKDLQRLEKSMANAIEIYNEHITELYGQLEKIKPKIDEKKLRSVIMEEVKEMVQEYENNVKSMEEKVSKVKGHVDKVKGHIEEIKSTPAPEPVTKIVSHSPLSNPEQKLLTILFNESDPLSYDAIAQKTGHSINTVRVNMNSLKKKGLIEEHTLPNGVKLFNLSNKEKIKKIYNLQVI